MSNCLPKLTYEELKQLEYKGGPPRHSFNETINLELFEEVLVLIEGEFTILKNGDAFILVNPGYVLGLKHLLAGRPYHIHFRTKNAKYVSLKKKELMDSNKNDSIFSIFQKYIELRPA